MPYCESCGHRVRSGAVCSVCESRDAQKIEEADEEYREFQAYDKDQYFTAGFVESGLSLEQAQTEVRNPIFVALCISFSGLEYLLKDRWATQGLLDAMLARDRRVLDALARYALRRLPHKKRGPKPDPKTGKYKQDFAVELRQKGKTLGQSALEQYGDPKRANLVAANISRANRKGGGGTSTADGIPVVIPGPWPGNNS